MSDKPRWNTIVIEVPSEMIVEDKRGKLKIKHPLTKTRNVASVNKQKSIILKEGDIAEPKIVNKGYSDKHYKDTLDKTKKTITQGKKGNAMNKLNEGLKKYIEEKRKKKTDEENKKQEIAINRTKETILKGKLNNKLKEYIKKKKNDENITQDKKTIQNIKDIYEYLYTSRNRRHKLLDDKKNILSDLIDASGYMEFYPTPLEYGKSIYDNIILTKQIKNNLNKLHILDLGAGLASLTLPFINKTNLTLIEYNKDIYNIIKPLEEENKNVIVENKNVLKLDINEYIDTDIIITNPPFNISIYDEKTKKNVNQKEGWLYFVYRAVQILTQQESKYLFEKYLYVLLPKSKIIEVNKNSINFNIPKTLNNKILKYLQIDDFDDDDYDEYESYLDKYILQKEYLSDVKGFKGFDKSGRPRDVNINVSMIRFIIK